MPLVNEVVIPVGQKDKWNGSKPADDAQFGSYVLDPEVPKLLQAIYKIPAPAAPRNDLVAVFLTGVAGLNQPPGVKPAEMLRLNTDIVPTASPARLGVLGGVKTSLGDGVNVNDVAFRRTFPYLAFPHSGGNPWKLNPNPATGQ